MNIFIIILAISFLLTIYGILVYNYKSKKRKEMKLRLKDKKLFKYYSEMINDRNDGWTKLHYEILYSSRLKKLTNTKK